MFKTSAFKFLRILCLLTLCFGSITFAGINHDAVNTFNHILIDARNNRGGNGDIGSAYLTAMELISELDFKGQITIVGTMTSSDGASTADVLSKITGVKVQDGMSFANGKITFYSEENLKSKISQADFYISLANPSGTFKSKYSSAGYIPVSSNEWLTELPLTKNAVLIAQTVFGNTENLKSINPFAIGSVDNLGFDIRSAGIAKNESGIYFDYVAKELRRKSQIEIKKFVLDESVKISNEIVKKNLINILNGNSLKNSKLGLAYGLSLAKFQIHSYLKNLSEQAKAQNKSFTIVTPSSFSIDKYSESSNEWAKDVIVVENNQSLPENAEPGKIYIVKTGIIPHKVFVGLLAYSEFPSVVSGDGALSAAIIIGKPFWMTKVDWNYKNIANLSNLLLSKIDSLASRLSLQGKQLSENTIEISKNRIRKILNGRKIIDGDKSTYIDASEGLQLNEDPLIRRAYQELASEVPSLTKSVVSSAVLLKRFSEGLSYNELVKFTDDPETQKTMLMNYLNKGDTTVLPICLESMKKNPEDWARYIMMGRISGAILNQTTILNIFINDWLHRPLPESAKVVEGAIKALTMIYNESKNQKILDVLTDKAFMKDYSAIKMLLNLNPEVFLYDKNIIAKVFTYSSEKSLIAFFNDLRNGSYTDNYDKFSQSPIFSESLHLLRHELSKSVKNEILISAILEVLKNYTINMNDRMFIDFKESFVLSIKSDEKMMDLFAIITNFKNLKPSNYAVLNDIFFNNSTPSQKRSYHYFYNNLIKLTVNEMHLSCLRIYHH